MNWKESKFSVKTNELNNKIKILTENTAIFDISTYKECFFLRFRNNNRSNTSPYTRIGEHLKDFQPMKAYLKSCYSLDKIWHKNRILWFVTYQR